MSRGILSGAIWGTVLSIGGLGALSVMAPDRVVAPVEDVAAPVAADVPVGAEGETSEVATAPQGETETPPAASESALPAQDAPQPETAAETLEPEDTTSEAPTKEAVETTDPVVESAPQPDDSGGTSGSAVTAPGVRPEDVTAVTPDASVPLLDTPIAEQNTMPAETEAAPVPAPETGETIAALAVPETSTAPVAPSVAVDQGAPGGVQAPVLSVPENEAGLSVSTEPAQPPVPPVPDVEAPLVPAPDTSETEPAESETAETGEESPAEESPAEESATEDSTMSERPAVRRLVPSAPEPAPVDTETPAAALRPAIGTPAASLTERSPGNSSRLPSIGAEQDAAPNDTPSARADTSGLPPLQRFAAQVDSDPSLPKMSIVMIDDGTGPLGPDTLEGFPFPVTFAIDPAQPGATDRMAAYRALGYEVAALVALPAAAQPTDVEQILGGAVAAVPEAVALIEAPGGGLQADRAVTEQAASFAADSGHGLVFLPNGLNTAQAIAQREAVPALSILRDFDGEGQDARTKRRFLDGAAFRARQDGAVVMLGRLTPDTLSALVLWGLQDRASSVSMVPVSTLLLGQSN